MSPSLIGSRCAPLRRTPRTTAAATALMLALSGCGSASQAFGGGVAAVMGKFQGDRGVTVLVVHQGVATRDVLMADVAPVVKTAAAEGSVLRVFMLPGGSAAGMREVAFSAAAGEGNFMPSGRNASSWADEATALEDAALKEIAAAVLPEHREQGQTADRGDDVLGAITRAISMARDTEGPGPRRVAVVTGGGVHRTQDLNLASLHVTPATATSLASKAGPIDVSDVDVDLFGVALFPNVEPEVDPVFAAGVRAFYEAVCPSCRIH